jgi:hypothetical protein
VVVPPSGGGPRTSSRLVAGRAVAPAAAAVTVTVAQPAGAARTFQWTVAAVPSPAQERSRAPVEPVTTTRQWTVWLKRACTPTVPPRAGSTLPGRTDPP